MFKDLQLRFRYLHTSRATGERGDLAKLELLETLKSAYRLTPSLIWLKSVELTNSDVLQNIHISV